MTSNIQQNSHLLIVASKIHAGQRILARGFLQPALVHVELTQDALPGWRTVARETVLPIYASASILARLGRAFVDVRGTVRPGESRSAFAMSALS